MDKAKAYDEALEKAKGLLDSPRTCFDINQLKDIFPQLKESDDERVRKDIIDHFESIKSRALYDNQEESDNIISSCNEKIAYLEKQKKPKIDIDKLRRDLYQSGYNDGYQHGKEDAQKEQKPTDDKVFEEWIDSWFKEHKEKAYPQITMDEKEFKNFCRGIRNMYQQKSDWSEEDERMLSRCIKSIECSKKFADSETYKAAKDVEINWLKDIYLNYKKFTEAVNKLWSNDWSEEDEEIIYSLRSFLIQAEQSGRYGSIQIAQIEQCLNWLKSVHPIKQDWTEEDEEIWFALITFFKTYLQKYPPACKDEKIQANRILKWLNTTIKSFRLHYRWKPSKEKMGALKNVAYGTYQNGDGPALRELYEQLLKLGVKEEPEYYQHFDPDC